MKQERPYPVSLTRYESPVIKIAQVVKRNDAAENIRQHKIKGKIYNPSTKPLCVVEESLACTRKLSARDFSQRSQPQRNEKLTNASQLRGPLLVLGSAFFSLVFSEFVNPVLGESSPVDGGEQRQASVADQASIT